MTTRRRRWLFAALAACVVVLAAARDARAAPAIAEQCATASEQAQLLRLQGHLVDARAELLTCSAPACPTVVRRDCDRWLGEVDDSLPSIVVTVRDAAGADVLDARMTIDGKAVGLDRVETRALQVDPGPHDIEVTGRDGGTPVKRTVVMREGEKRRPVEISLPRPAPRPTPAPTAAPPAVRAESGNGARTAGWSLVVAGGVFASAGVFFAVRQHVLYQSAEEECAPGCGPGVTDEIDSTRLFEAIAFGTGAAALAFGIYLLVTHPKKAPAALGPGILRF